MKGQVVLKSIGILIMLLQHVTMINVLAAILNFVGFGWKKASIRLVTLAVTAPAHYKMAQMKL